MKYDFKHDLSMRALTLLSALMSRAFLAAFSFLTMSSASAALTEAVLTEESYFEELSRIPANYKVFGTVCEEMARIDLEQEFPPDFYEIKVGIQYRDASRTIGELDVIVFRRSDEEAMMVAEVKCWRNFKKALTKANKQLSRFQNTRVRGDEICYIGREFEYHWTQFDEITRYEKISQLGGRKQGFDRTLTLDLSAIKRIRSRLIRCQKSRQCAVL